MKKMEAHTGSSEVPNVNFPLQIYVVNPIKLILLAPF